MKTLFIAFVTSLQPETHYSRFLIEALQVQSTGGATLLIYADQDPRNAQLRYKDLALVWTPSLAFPFQIARQAWKDKPALVHVQHEINMYGGPLTAILFPLMLVLLRLTGAKVVVTIHSVVAGDQIDGDFMRTFSWSPSAWLIVAVRLFFALLYRSIAVLANGVIVHSRYMAELLEKHYGVSAQQITAIPIGVPEPNHTLAANIVFDRPWASALDQKKMIVYFGYIIRRKGLEYLIEAFQQIHSAYPEYVLVLAGGELNYQRDYAQQLREDVARRGLGHCILFTSFITAEEIERLFARCEFVVLPYTYSISSSLPLSFAMQYGKPVIATQLGTLAEEVEAQINGMLVPPRDASALADAMRQLMRDGMLLQRLSQGARAKAQRRSWNSVAEQTMQVYRAVSGGLGA